MDFYIWYLESPEQATAVFLIMVVIVIFGFCVMAYSKHKEEQKRIQVELWRKSRGNCK